MDDIHDSNVMSRYQVPRHRLTIRDYHRLGEAGVLSEDDRIELLEGQLELYARAGIREFWVVDLTSNRVLGHRGPSDGRYSSITTVDVSGTLEIEALPGVSVSAARIFV